LPVALAMFFGIKRMFTLPVEQLKHSGVEFLLTVIYPTGTMIIGEAEFSQKIGLSKLSY
jgi:hypothetical protein